MRILIVGLRWPPETFIVRLLRSLLHAGYDITVATKKQPDASWQQPNFHWLPLSGWGSSKFVRFLHLGWLALSVMRHIPRGIKRFKQQIPGTISWKRRLRYWYELLPFVGQHWDVIYFPWNATAIRYLPLFDQADNVLISCRGSHVNIKPYDPRMGRFREKLRETFGRATAIHCVSQAILDEASQWGLSPNKSWIIRPAVDPEFFKPSLTSSSETENGVFHIVTIGSLIWLKGYEYALQAIYTLRKAGLAVQFDIIGDGVGRERIIYTIQDLELEDCVHLHNAIPPIQVRDILQKSHAFVLASLSEGISNAVLEAMACSLPIVTTNCGGMTEVITDGCEGFIVPMYDAHQIANRLWQLAQDPELRKRMGHFGRQRILQEFTLTHQTNQFVALFRSLKLPHDDDKNA